jgi:AraC-like DNA-binding protein
VEYWGHQVKLGRTTMEDQVKSGSLPLDDIDGRILACISREPFFTVRSIAQVLGLAPATIHRRFTISLDLKLRHFRWSLTC